MFTFTSETNINTKTIIMTTKHFLVNNARASFKSELNRIQNILGITIEVIENADYIEVITDDEDARALIYSYFY